jgi:hypothetical protein
MPGKRFVKSRPFLRENDHVITSLVELAAVAVEFHLVKPGVAGWWSDTQGGLSGNDERRGTQHRIEYTSVRLRGEEHGPAWSGSKA